MNTSNFKYHDKTTIYLDPFSNETPLISFIKESDRLDYQSRLFFLRRRYESYPSKHSTAMLSLIDLAQGIYDRL